MGAEEMKSILAEWGVPEAVPQPKAQPSPFDKINTKAKSSPAMTAMLAEWGEKPDIEVDPETERGPLRYGSFKVAPGGAPPGVRTNMGALKSEVEKHDYLVSEFGQDNVLPVLGQQGDDVIGFRFRASDKEPWRFVDPSPGDVGQGGGKFESMVRDAVGDAADVAVPLMLEAAPGAAAQVVGNAVAGPVGGAVAGTLMDAAGPYLTDAYASKLPGYDPSQHQTGQDAVIAGGASAAFNALPFAGRFLKPGVHNLARKAGKELVLDEGAEKVAIKTGAEMVGDRMALSKRTATDLTPAQATGSRAMLQMQDAASSIGKHANEIRAVEVNQARQANEFLNLTLNRIGPDVDSATAGTAVARAYENYLKKLSDVRRGATKPLFDEAEKALGGERVIPINGFLDSVDEMIARYKSPGSSSGTQSLVKQLETMRAGLVAEGGQRSGVSVSELSAMLSDWGGSAKSGAMDVFKDTDPRRARAAAARLFGALKNDMDVAASDEALGPAAGALRKARDTYAELSRPIEEARSSLLTNALKMEGERPDMIGAAFAQSRSPAQIKRALDIVSKADPEAAVMLKRDMLNAVVEGAEAGAERARARIDISPQKFASQMSLSKNRAKVMAIVGTGDDAAESMRMWNDAIEIMSVISDRGLPPGSPTASRLLNAAMDVGGLAMGIANKGRAVINSKMFAELASDPVKRDEFYSLIGKKGKGMSGAGKAWLGADALLQLGVIEMRDAEGGSAQYNDISSRRQRVAPGVEIARE